MKTITKILMVTVILLNVCLGNQSGFKVILTEPVYTSANSLEFEIRLLSSGDESGSFKYSIGQYFFEFNTKIANGGTLTYSIVNSDLPESMMPRNPSVSGNLLRLAANPANSDRENLPVVSGKNSGLLIARMKLETSAKKFAEISLGLKHAEGKFKTKVFAFAGNKNTELANNEIEFQSPDKVKECLTYSGYSLLQNYPNPFNPETKISFALQDGGFTSLKVYDIAGKEVAALVNQQLNPGKYEVKFDGSNLASGMYFYKLQSGKFSQTMRMILLK